MTYLINFIIIFLILFGLINFNFYALNYKNKLNKTLLLFVNEKNNYEKNLFILSITILATFGLIASINTLFFCINKNIYYTLYLFIPISILGYFFFYKTKYSIISFVNFKEILNYRYSNLKLVILDLLIFILFLFVVNRIFVDWNDQDELTQYGKYTKLFAQGWIIGDNIFETYRQGAEVFGSFTRFGELMFSPFYLIGDNFILTRTLRTLIFLLNLSCFYFLIKNLTNSKIISKISVLLVITIPEFSYLGPFSLKVDFLLFSYEITSIIFLCIALDCYINKKKKIDFEIFSFLIFFSTLFSFFAFSIKLTGAYLLLVNLIIYFLVIFNNFKFFLKKKNFLPILIILLFLFICFPQLLHQIIKYNNPFYPLNGPWLFFFKDGLFDVGQWGNLAGLKEDFNINFFYPVINEIYIIVYSSLGFARSFYNDFWFSKFIIHPSFKETSAWLSPFTLIILLTPFYFKKIPITKYLFVLFIFLFFLWSINLQWVRTLIAMSCISIIIFSLIMIYEKNKKNYLFKFFSISSIITIIILLIYHFDVSSRNNPYNVSMFFNENLKYQDNVVKSLPRKEWNKYISNDLKYLLNFKKKDNRNKALRISDNYFDKKDIDNINRLIKPYKKIFLIHNIKELNLNTLIKYGYVVKFSEDKMNFYLKNYSNNKKVCLLIYEKSIILPDNFSLKFNNLKGLDLYCN